MKTIIALIIIVCCLGCGERGYGEDKESGKDLESVINENYLLSILYTDIKVNELTIELATLKAEVEELRKMVEGINNKESMAIWPKESESAILLNN